MSVTPTQFIEQFSGSAIPLTNGKTYNVSVDVPNEHVQVRVMWGTTLAGAGWGNFVKETSKKSVRIPVSESGVNLWILTFIEPRADTNTTLEFGYQIGEDNADIATIDVHLRPNEVGATAPLNDLPIDAFIPNGYASAALATLGTSMRGGGTPKTRMIAVRHGAGTPTRLELGATVFLFNPTDTKIYGTWRQPDLQNPVSVPIAASNDMKFFCLINGVQTVTDGVVQSAFDVGDPRREAMVTLTEEA